MISGATEEELIVANARAEVLTKCGKDILDILDNQNEKYEKQLEHEVEYQNNEVVRLNNIIDELIIKLTPDYENYKKLIDKRDIIDSLTESYWLGVAETSEYVLDKLKGGE